MVTREYPPFSVGGISRHTFELTKHLEKIDCDCTVVSFGNITRKQGSLIYLGTSSDILNTLNRRDKGYLRRFTGDLRILCDIRRLNRYATAIANHDHFDILHVQDPIFGPFVKHRNIVTTVHVTRMGELSALRNSIHCLSDLELAVFFSSFGLAMDWINIQKTKVFIAINEHVKNELIHFYKVSPSDIYVVPNGIDIPTYFSKDTAKSQLGLSYCDNLILAVGRMVPRKCFEVLLQAVAYLKRHDSPEFKVIIVGEGPLKPRLMRISRTLGVDEIISFVGQIDDALLRQYYMASDVFVLPSRYEGHPMTLLEAMANSVCCIATDIPAVRNTLTPNVDSLLFPVGNYSKLAEILRTLVQDKRLRQKLASAARTKALAFSWERIAERTREIYEIALSQ